MSDWYNSAHHNLDWNPVQSEALVIFSASSNSDDDLPSYLRGLNWAKVQEYSK